MNKRAFWLSLCLLIGLVHPSIASAHASLLTTDPPSEALLASVPATVTLSFNEQVEPLVIRFVDENGFSSPITQIDRQGNSLSFAPPPSASNGARVVSWRVISADGHPVGGSFTFWVGARGTPRSTVSSDNSSVRAAIWICGLLVHLGLFIGAGGAFFIVWMEGSIRIKGSAQVVVVASAAALAPLACSIGLQGLDALASPPSALADAQTWRTGAAGSFGVSAAIACASLVLGLLSLLGRGSAQRLMSCAALIGVGLALASTGHAANAPPTYLTRPAVFLHGVGLAFWIGALAPLALALTEYRGRAGGVLARFSRWIPFAVSALLASGVLIAVLQLTRLDALWTTDYGQILLVKIGLLSALFALALWNRFWLTPQIASGRDRARSLMRGSIVAELALALAILGVVGLWRFTPPPRALAEDESFFQHIHSDKAMANVTISPGRAGPVVIEIELETGDERPLMAKALSVTLTNTGAGIEPITAEAENTGENQWQVKMSAPVAGRWELGLGILISDFDKVTIEAPIQLR